jgi:hypothetical protein
MIVGEVSLSHATHNVPGSSTKFGFVAVLRASRPDADPVQKREPQSGDPLVPRCGSPETAAMAALGKIADEPTAITLQLIVEPAD